jgi:arabinofuranan 3-O-arabinosyltransferase
MAFAQTSATPMPGLSLPRPVELTCFALCVVNAAYLAGSLLNASWFVGPDGQTIATDFVNVWAAGRHVLDGDPAAAYDVARQKAAEVAALGHSFDGEYPWLYPPGFLFVATALALLPYITAWAMWLVGTFPAYLIAIRGIVGDRTGLLLACAYPGIVSNFMVGQNGFLTAALIGGTLICMERRPLLAGCLLGVLSFKPHLGILFPLVLVASGRWQVLGTAAAGTALVSAAAWAAFGTGAWEAFLHALPVASQASLADGRADFAKLQSIFGLVRMLGGGETLAFALQGAMATTVAIVLCLLWRSKASFDLKAAALATGALLATPYIFLYDLVVLAVPMAFLIRASRTHGALRGEMGGLANACLLILAFPFVQAPVGFAAVLLVALLIGRRALAQPRPTGAIARQPNDVLVPEQAPRPLG